MKRTASSIQGSGGLRASWHQMRDGVHGEVTNPFWIDLSFFNLMFKSPLIGGSSTETVWVIVGDEQSAHGNQKDARCLYAKM